MSSNTDAAGSVFMALFIATYLSQRNFVCICVW
jgi:hypothetical protein